MVSLKRFLLLFKDHHILILWLFDYLWIVHIHTHTHTYNVLFIFPPERLNHWAPLVSCRFSLQARDGSYTFCLVRQMRLTANGYVLLHVDCCFERYWGCFWDQYKTVPLWLWEEGSVAYILHLFAFYVLTLEDWKCFPIQNHLPPQSFGPCGPQWCHSSQNSCSMYCPTHSVTAS